MMQRATTAVVCGMLLCLNACDNAPSTTVATPAEKAQAQPDNKANADGVTLPQEQVGKLGIVTEAATAADYTAETTGYGVVVPHESIANAVAELTTAELTEKQTQAALTRVKSLEGTPGALSAEVEEAANRQSAADNTAQVLATQRLSTVIGSNPAWKAEQSRPLLKDLASGKIKLVRATFPLGTLHGSAPKTLRIAHLDSIQSSSLQALLGTKLSAVWDAPADISVPGRSFFALLRSGDYAEGERLLAWAPDADPTQVGVLVPAAALVISRGKYWCYVEKQSGQFQRVEVDTERPLAVGYVVTGGIQVGDKVVTSAAGLLLARETNTDTDAD